MARKAATIHAALDGSVNADNSTVGFTCRGPNQWEVTRIYIAAAGSDDTFVSVHHLTGSETVADVATLLLKDGPVPGNDGLDTELTNIYMHPDDTIVFVTVSSNLTVSHVSARELAP